MIPSLIKAGLKLCHIPAGSKAPIGQDWPNKGVTKWDGRSNVGIIHGLNNTCSVDIDHYPYSKLALAAVGIDLVDLLTAGPRIIGNPDRAKVIFKLPDGHNLKKHTLVWPRRGTLEPVTVLELRCGQHQDVIHGTHPDGHPYQIQGDLTDIPMIPDDLLQVWQNWDAAKGVLLQACPWCVPPKSLTRQVNTFDKGESVIDKFNATFFALDLLMEQGYTRHGDRLLSPWSNTKIPAIKMFDDGKHFWNWGGGPFSDGLPHDAFDVFTEFTANGDQRQAVKLAAELLGMKREPVQATVSKVDQVSTEPFSISNYRAGIDPLPEMPPGNYTPLDRSPASPIPPGQVIGDLITWLAQTNGSAPQYALTMAGLSFLSAMFARRYCFDSKSPINLYLGVHCDSVAQLSSLIAILRQATASCGERKIIRADAFSSGSYLKKSLNTSARLYWVTGEYVGAMSFSAKQNNSRGYDSAANTIRDIYSGNQIFIDAESWGTNKEPIDIFQPSLTIMGFMATGEIHKITKKEEYYRGMLQQLFLVEGGPTVDGGHDDSDLPDHLIDYFKQTKPGGGLANLETPSLKPKMTFIKSDIVWSDYDGPFHQIAHEHPAWNGIALGWKKIFKRICGVLAVAQDLVNPVVTPEIAAWSQAWVVYHLLRYMERLDILGTEQGELDVSQRVHDLIYRAGVAGMTARELRLACRPYRRLSEDEKNKLELDLLLNGDVRKVPVGKAERYFSIKFLEQIT